MNTFVLDLNYHTFLNEEYNGGEKSLLELNLTIHYIFEITEYIGVYPLTGLNYSFEKENYHGEIKNDVAFRLKISIGIHYVYKTIFPFIEYKYIYLDLAQHILSAGILFNFSKK